MMKYYFFSSGLIKNKEMANNAKYKAHSNLSIRGALCVTLLFDLNISPPGI